MGKESINCIRRGRRMIDENIWYQNYAEKREEWNILFNLCLKYKQWDLLEEYWKKIEEEKE